MSSNRRKMLEAIHTRKKLKKDYSSTKRSYGEVNRQCLKKNAYSTLRTAQRVMNSIKEERGTVMRIYKCEICGFYHMTHKR